jgi:uncharacterized protein (DUF4415 family)
MNKDKSEMVYIQTEEEYKKGLAKGWTDEDMLKPGTYKARKSPWAAKLKNAKRIKVSIYLEDEVLTYFRQRAEQPNAAPYQTQINNELRKIMEADSLGKTSLDKSILEDTEFLKALKEKLETV